MKKIKITILIMMLLCVKLAYSQCSSFEYVEVNSGNDFLNLNRYSNIEICESSGSIQLGSKTFYILGESYRNNYGQGDFIYDIQEARGYWPKIGFVKVSTDFSLIQLKFMNSVVTYKVNIKKEKGDEIILSGDYFANDDQNSKLSLKFSENTVCTQHDNDKLTYCYKFEQVQTNNLKSIGDFSYEGDLSYMKNVKGTFELTKQRLTLIWNKNIVNYIIISKDNRAEIEKERQDILKINEINSEINNGRFFRAQILYHDLFIKKPELLLKIKEGISVYESKLNNLYIIYKDAFNQKMKELHKDENFFLEKYKNKITTNTIYTKKFSLDSINLITKLNSEKNTINDNEIEENLYYYSKHENKHHLCPVGIKSNFFIKRYDTSFVDQIKILVKLDTTLNIHFGEIEFLNKNRIYSSGLIFNSFPVNIKSFYLDYTKDLNDLINEINEQGGNILVTKYPRLFHTFDYEETISYNNTRKIIKPNVGTTNKSYQDIRDQFNKYDLKLDLILNHKNFQNVKVLATKNFYNPLLLFLSKSLFPDADSIMFEYSFNDYFVNLGDFNDKAIKINTALDGSYMFDKQIGRIIPLIKGKIEFKNNMLLIYGNDGVVKNVNISFLKEGFYNLKNINVNNLDLDSSFYDHKYTMIKYNSRLYSGFDKIDYLNLEPTIANQTLINLYYVGEKIKSNARFGVNYDDVNFTYFKGDSIIIQVIPTYNISEFNNNLTVLSKTKHFKETSNSQYYSPTKALLNIAEETKYGNTIKYFHKIMKFIELKNAGNVNDAEKTIKKANKMIIK